MAQSADAPSADRARRLERLGRYRWEMGDPRAAVEATEQAMAVLAAKPPSRLQARVLAALATRRMFLGEPAVALPLAVRAVTVARQVDADAEHAHALATLGIIKAQRGDLDAGLADLGASFTLAYRSRSIEDVVRVAGNHSHLLYRAGRFADAYQVARDGRNAAHAMDAPPTITAILGNNSAAALVASGRWAEAERLLTELVRDSGSTFIRYLHLLQLELAVGRGEGDRAAELAATLRKSPADPRFFGPLYACLAEQALNADDLVVAAAELMDGFAALRGAALAEEEIRLLAAGARLAADLALLPQPLRPPDIPGEWEALADTFTGRTQAIAAGTLLMSRQFAASVALSSPPEGTGSVPHDIHLPTPVLYLPSSAGPQVTFPGYVLPFGTHLEELASQIETAMTQRQTCTVPILGSLPEGQLVLNGAVLPFVVLCPPTPGPTSIPSGTGSVPHD